MNWLFDNPLANLPGTYFLMLYAAVITAALVVYRLVKNGLDQTLRLALPPVPREPDPFEIAFLRGGANELARSLVFALTQKGFLQIRNGDKESWIEQTGAKPERQVLTTIERRAFEWFSTPRQPKELFVPGGLITQLHPFKTTYEARLESAQFLTDEKTRTRLRGWTMIAALLIVGLGGYKLVAAVANGYSNFWFLIILGVVGTVILLGMSRLPRLTKRGQFYLERLQLAYEKLKFSAAPVNQAQPAYARAGVGAIDPMLLMVGVFGGTALAGTNYDSYNQAFHKSHQSSVSSGSSCGSSCGTSWDSSSSSGSSSGDGGSSCGGGGCGGCGGGGCS